MRHPGWTWDDLQNTPADIIVMMREIERSEAQVKEARMNQREAKRG